MKIGLSMKVVTGRDGERYDSISQRWTSLIRDLGWEPVILPNILTEAPSLDGIILTGGNNVNPALYGGLPVEEVYPERDAAEELFVEAAVAGNVPVLGVCRGFQFLNVRFGGSITQGITGHAGSRHDIVWRGSERILVDSYHRHGVLSSDLAPRLTTLGKADDGVVEAFMHEVHPVLAVQWHPERGRDLFSLNLLKRFFCREEIQ